MAKFIGWVVIIKIIVAVIMNLGDDSEDSSSEIATTETKPEPPSETKPEPPTPKTARRISSSHQLGKNKGNCRP